MADLQELINSAASAYGASDSPHVNPSLGQANVSSPMMQDIKEGFGVLGNKAAGAIKAAYLPVEDFSNKAVAGMGVAGQYAFGETNQAGLNESLKDYSKSDYSDAFVSVSSTNPPQVSSVTKPAANPPAAATEKPKTLLGDDATKKGVKLNTPIAEPPDVVSPKLGDNATQQGVTLNDELAGGYGMDFLKNLHQLDVNRQGEMVNQQRAAERDRFNEQTRLDNLLAKSRETKTEWIHNEKGGGWKEVTVPANPVEASLAKEILAERNAYGAMPQAELAEAKKSDFQRYNAELGLLGNITKEQSNAKAALAGKLMDYNMNQAKLDLETKKFVAQQGLDYDKLTAEQRQKQAELYLNMSKAQSEMDQNTWKNYEVKNEMGNPDPKQTLWNIFQAFKDNPDAAPVNLRPQLASIRDQYVTWRKNWHSQFKGKNPSQADFDAMNEGFKQNIRLM